MIRRLGLVVGLMAIGALAQAGPAGASYHEMKVTEVSAGTVAADGSYVEVQMYAPGQNFLTNGGMLAVCNDICSIVPAEFGPFGDVANGANQATVLFGDSAIPAGQKDFNLNGLNLENFDDGGAVCWFGEPGFSDCVSWGSFNANDTLTSTYGTTAGTPAPALTIGSALNRSIAPGCPTLLEAADDTNNSAADFSTGPPSPRTNAATPTEAQCPTPTTPATPKKKKKCKKVKKKSQGKAYEAKKKKKCKKKKKRR
jgi:hypothetical protein